MTLPPDDMPPVEFVPASDEEALADLGEMSPYNPMSIAAAFFAVLSQPEIRIDDLEQLVTPESRPGWGDFSAAAAAVQGYTLTSRPNIPLGPDMQPMDDVRYAKLVEDTGETYQVVGDAILDAKIITLQRRPDCGGWWLVHALGDYVKPEDLPQVV